MATLAWTSGLDESSHRPAELSSKLFDVAHRLNAGVIWANGYNLFDPASPFGGVRHSGFGREGGVAGLWPYLKFEGGQ